MQHWLALVIGFGGASWWGEMKPLAVEKDLLSFDEKKQQNVQ